MRGRSAAFDLAAVALTVAAGIHSLRTFLSMVVWNIGEDRPAGELGLIALGIWAIGFLAWPAARRFGGTRSEVRLGTLFLLVYAANYFVRHPVLAAILGTASAVLWLWFVPALIVALGRRGTAQCLAPGLLLGFIFQVSLQHAMHGLDLPMRRGFVPGVEATVLALGIYLSLRAAAAATGASAAANGAGLPGWGLAALGPYLVLQLTLLSNPGRVQMLTGFDLLKADGVIVLGLLAGIVGLGLPLARRMMIAAAAIAVVAALLIAQTGAYGAVFWELVAVQILLSPSLAWALRPVPGTRPGRVHGAFVAAAVLLFVLVFLFYSRYGWMALWPVMALLTAILSLASVASLEGVARRIERPAFLLAAAFVAGAIVLNFLGRPTAAPVEALAPDELQVLDYNIHQAFNYWSVPDPEATARVIETSSADLVALQEVGRGWNVNGGPDLVAWLRWRLPQYYLVYGPMNGDLWGNVILSRYPIRESGWETYPVRVSAFRRGLTWAIIPSRAGDLLFVNTHLSAYAGYDVDRAGQAGDLLAFWKGRPRTIIAGDFNAGPDDAAIRRVLAAKLIDVPARHGLGAAFTSPSGAPRERIDYIFASPNMESLSAAILQTTASDHLPVLARLKVR